MKDGISFKLIKPSLGEEVLAYSPEWIDIDFNPKGIRLGFLNESEDGPFISAYWDNERDYYKTDDITLPEIWKKIE